MRLDDMVDALVLEVPGCPRPLIRDMLRWAQRELCTEGNAWIFNDGPVVVGANTPYAEVEVPSGAEALRLIDLRLPSGQTLKPGYDYLQTGSNGVEFLRGRPDSITLLGSMACRPAHGQDMPAELLARWSGALMEGARYRLLLLPQPWQNPQLAELYRRQFLVAQSDARQLARQGYQSGTYRAHPRFT